MAAQSGDGGAGAQPGAQENYGALAQLVVENTAANAQAEGAEIGVVNIVANVALVDGDDAAARALQNRAVPAIGAAPGNGAPPVVTGRVLELAAAPVAPVAPLLAVPGPVRPNLAGVNRFDVDAALEGPLSAKGNFYEVYPRLI